MHKTFTLTWVLCMSFFSLMAQHKAPHLVENRGQWPTAVVAAADVQGGKVFLEKGAITYHLFDLGGMRAAHDDQGSQPRVRGHVYRVHFAGSNGHVANTSFKEKQTTYSNYFLGSDKRNWAGNCGHYHEAVIHSLYDKVSMHMHAGAPFLKYDFVVEPYGDASQIRMRYEGHEKLSIDQERLVVTTSIGDVTEQKPLAWQIIDGTKHLVACRFRIQKNEVTFDFPKGYDERYELIIDPELVFSTYSGSTSNNFGYTATYDQAGSLYSGSSAFGQNYPTILGAYDTTHNGGDSTIEQGIDIALSKYNLNGTFMLWSTFLGGQGDELPHSIIVNEAEELIVYGSTGSSDFPTTANAHDTTFGGGPAVAPTGTGANFPAGADIIVSRLSSWGSELLASTYLGGSANDGICDAAALKYNYADEFRGEVELDSEGNILIVSSTRSTDIAAVNAIQVFPGGGLDALIAKLNVELTQVQWMTYYGGSGDDSGFSIAENAQNQHYICGGTTSPDLNLGGFGAQTSYGGGIADAYILKLSQAGNQVLGGTFWGANAYDQAYFIEVDNENNVYIFGQTASGNSLIQNATYSNPNSGNLIAKFNDTLTASIWSTVVGTGNGKPNLAPAAFLVDYCNRIYVSGWGVNDVVGNPLNPGDHLHAMFTMPTTGDAFDNTCSSGDFYMAVYDENMTTLEYGTFFGGSSSNEHVDGGTSRFDKKGVIYQSVCAGCGGLDDFPISSPDVLSPINPTANGCNNGVYKFDFQLPITVADFYNAPTDCIGNITNFYNNSVGAEQQLWDFGDGTTSQEINPAHVYENPGTYTITLTVSSSLTCNGEDAVQHTITITAPDTLSLEDVVVCGPPNNLLSMPSDQGLFTWTPNENLSDPNSYITFYNGAGSQDFEILQNNVGCLTTYYLHVDVLQFVNLTTDTVLCEPAEITLTADFTPENALIVWSDSDNWGFNTQLNDDSTDVDITLQAFESDIYYVQIISGECSAEQPVYIELADSQTSVQPDFTICDNETLTLSVENPSPQFDYSWTPEEFIIAGQNTSTIIANIDQTTLFTVTSNSDQGCTASDSVLVSLSALTDQTVSASANPAIIAPGESSLLQAEPYGYSYAWTPSNSINNPSIQNPLATPVQTTFYTVVVSDSQCSISDSVEVRVFDLVCAPPNVFIPNTFTPNADGKNEKLYVRGLNLSKVHLAIYNRWGQVVFETFNQNEGWDGTFKEMKVDPDVFVYYLEATCTGGEEYFEKGNITLIR
jgi:gliding motility-associated-like protein